MDWIYTILVIIGIGIGIVAFTVAVFMIDEKQPYSFTSMTIDLLEELEKELENL